MSIQTYFNRKKSKFITFFNELSEAVHQVSLAVQLEIDRQYDLASQLLKNSSQHIIEGECEKMREREEGTLIRIMEEISNHIKKSITNPALFVKRQIQISRNSFNTPQKYKTKSKSIEFSRNKYQSGSQQNFSLVNVKSSAVLNSFASSSASKSSQVCENLDRKIQNEALDYLQKSEKRSKHSKNNLMRKNIINMSPSSQFKGSVLSQLIRKKQH